MILFMTPKTTATLLAITVCLGAGSAAAATIGVPGTRATLAEALAHAAPGDVIELQPGRHLAAGLRVDVPVTIRGLGDDAAAVVVEGDGRQRLLTCEGVDGPVVLQNLTLRGGAAAGTTSRLRSGGAVFVSRTELIAQNVRFVGNSATAHGGAIRFVSARGYLSQCEFSGNSALLGGGAVDCSYSSSPLIERCSFVDNVGAWGGALSCRGSSSPDVVRTVFHANATSDLYGYGGGLFSDLESSPQLVRCTFTGNRAAYGGALGCFQGSRVGVDHCTMVENAATGAGAGIYCIDGSPRVTGSILAFQQGAGVASVGLALPELGCSTVYGSAGADISGPVTGVPGADPVISADPAFCAPAGAPAGVLPVAADSPVADGSCGVMGAWPAACDLPLPTVGDLTARAAVTGALVLWRASGDHAGARYRLTWSADGGAEREAVFRQSLDGGFLAEIGELPGGAASVVFRVYVADGTGRWTLAADSDGTLDGDGGDDELPAAPAHLAVRNWPNPFNPETTIAVAVRRSERVRVGIYGVDGRLVRRLADRVFTAGEEQLRFDGRDDGGRALSSGTYLVRVAGASETRVRKITLLK